MCEYIERCNKDSVTHDIREWLPLAHPVCELTGPFHFGEEANRCLWLGESAINSVLDMCDALDLKFESAETENAKLRDQMYERAHTHVIHHMDEDELRMWATQQADLIEKLRELCKDMFDRLRDKDEHCGECRTTCDYDAWNFGDERCAYTKRMCECGIEVER